MSEENNEKKERLIDEEYLLPKIEDEEDSPLIWSNLSAKCRFGFHERCNNIKCYCSCHDKE